MIHVGIIDGVSLAKELIRSAANPSSDYSENEEHKLHTGSWDWKSYILKGKKQAHFAAHCPRTVEFLEVFHSSTVLSSEIILIGLSR
jgi:aspartate beta-hydroxylase